MVVEEITTSSLSSQRARIPLGLLVSRRARIMFHGVTIVKLVSDLREMKRTKRAGGDEEKPSNFAIESPTSQNFRFEKNPVFDAGVTSIESKGDFLYVGSYDGACRAFDVRKSLKEPTWISRGDDDEKEEGNDASIWRVRLHPNFKRRSAREQQNRPGFHESRMSRHFVLGWINGRNVPQWPRRR